MKYRELFLLIQSFAYESTGYKCFPATEENTRNRGKLPYDECGFEWIVRWVGGQYFLSALLEEFSVFFITFLCQLIFWNEPQ